MINDKGGKYMYDWRKVIFTVIMMMGANVCAAMSISQEKPERVGEFRCKWDSSVQWFSVESIVY